MNFTIVKESKDQHVPMGGNVEMYCSATGFPTPKVAIYTEENSKMVEVVSSMKPIYYTMSNIQPKDAKKYICNATNIAGTSRQEKQFTVKCKSLCYFLSVKHIWLNFPQEADSLLC